MHCPKIEWQRCDFLGVMFPIHHDTDKEIHKSKWHNKMIMKKKLRLGQKKRLDYFIQKPKETQAI